MSVRQHVRPARQQKPQLAPSQRFDWRVGERVLGPPRRDAGKPALGPRPAERRSEPVEARQ
jgi:hypothetical protein